MKQINPIPPLLLCIIIYNSMPKSYHKIPLLYGKIPLYLKKEGKKTGTENNSAPRIGSHVLLPNQRDAVEQLVLNMIRFVYDCKPAHMAVLIALHRNTIKSLFCLCGLQGRPAPVIQRRYSQAAFKKFGKLKGVVVTDRAGDFRNLKAGLGQ